MAVSKSDFYEGDDGEPCAAKSSKPTRNTVASASTSTTKITTSKNRKAKTSQLATPRDTPVISKKRKVHIKDTIYRPDRNLEIFSEDDESISATPTFRRQKARCAVNNETKQSINQDGDYDVPLMLPTPPKELNKAKPVERANIDKPYRPTNDGDFDMDIDFSRATPPITRGKRNKSHSNPMKLKREDVSTEHKHISTHTSSRNRTRSRSPVVLGKGRSGPFLAKPPSIYTTKAAKNDEPDSPDDPEPSPAKVARQEKIELNSEEVFVEQLKAKNRQLDMHEARGDLKGWTNGERALFREISLRGFKPLLPFIWHLDFPTFPPRLWGWHRGDTFINATMYHNQNANFRASAALRKLVDMGTIARDRLQHHPVGRPDVVVARAINSYVRWSHVDAALDRRAYSPMLFITTDERPAAAAERMITQMRHWAEVHREQERTAEWVRELESVPEGPAMQIVNMEQKAQGSPGMLGGWWGRVVGFVTGGTTGSAPQKLAHDSESTLARSDGLESENYAPVRRHASSLPNASRNARKALTHSGDRSTLYGFMISHLIVHIVTYHVSGDDDKLRTICKLDYSVHGYDVWNALAIAITVCHVRNALLANSVELIPTVESDSADA